MINKEAKTYNEIIIKKKCYDLLKYINVSNEELNKMYEYLIADKKNHRIIVTQENLFYNDGKSNVETYPVVTKTTSFDRIAISCVSFVIIPHHEPYSSSGGDYSSGGGFSSNNNNNNNNNNNQNRQNNENN